jgi:hypothetical protein
LCQGRKSRGELNRLHLVRSKVCFSASVSTEINDQGRQNRTVYWTFLILLTREFYDHRMKSREELKEREYSSLTTSTRHDFMPSRFGVSLSGPHSRFPVCHDRCGRRPFLLLYQTWYAWLWDAITP